MSYPILSAFDEISAYEALWDRPKTSYRTLAEELSDFPLHLASSLVESKILDEYKKELLPILKSLPKFGARIEGDGSFPSRLKDARYPIKIFYYQGNWELSYLPCVSIVGTRNPTKEGIDRTKYLVKCLVQDGFVIVSGLAKGIDTAAHQSAIEYNGETIAVIGTPLNQYYPSENRSLQQQIAQEHLLISQVPFSRYSKQDYRTNRFFFPERNVTMAALSQATIIVEAGETSGTLVQARAAIEQGRKLFILENNFLQPSLTWPQKLQKQGAIRAIDYDQIRQHLTSSKA